MRLDGWEVIFVVVVMGVAGIVCLYTEARRLLYAAVDDRYGEWVRFWERTAQVDAGRRFLLRAQYIVAFLFSYGIHDTMRLVTMVGFDVFVVFALLSPFWRYVFFEDWNAALAVAMGLAGISVFVGWKARQGRDLCLIHTWTEPDRRCERCGEPYVAPEPSRKFSWHGLWERRLVRISESVE